MKGIILIALLALCDLGEPFSAGPPDNANICNSMYPNHPDEAQPGDAPFTITPDSSTYTAGQQIEGRVPYFPINVMHWG